MWKEANALHLAQVEVQNLTRQLAERDTQIAQLMVEKHAIQVAAKEKADRRITDLKKRYNDNFNRVRISASYQLGNSFVLAFRKPGRNTLMLPFRLGRIVLEAFIAMIMR